MDQTKIFLQKGKDKGDEPTKEEYALAKYVRFNCSTKSTLIMGNDMHYFTASKAVDCLMSSKWASEKAKNRLFTNRQSCVDFMQSLLEKSLLFRAKKLVRKRKDRPANSAESAKDQQAGASSGSKLAKDSTSGVVKRKDSLEKSPQTKKRNSNEERKEKEAEEKDQDDEKDKKDKKKPKKVKFEFHPEQVFVDGNDIYVWKYDPTSTKTFLLGLAIVIGAIGVCLFPLWPPQVRIGVYYLSLVAMGFVGVIISLVIIRSVVFGVVWASTWGKHTFWLLPNLTEDCGFFDSFKPFYSHKIAESESKKSSKDAEDKKEPKAKVSDKEESSEDEKDEEKEEERDVDKEESEDEEGAKNGPTDTDRLSDEESEDGNN